MGSREGLAPASHFLSGLVLPEQMNAEAHVRMLEDNLSEANAKVAELEWKQAEINAIRTRLRGEPAPPREPAPLRSFLLPKGQSREWSRDPEGK